MRFPSDEESSIQTSQEEYLHNKGYYNTAREDDGFDDVDEESAFVSGNRVGRPKSGVNVIEFIHI